MMSKHNIYNVYNANSRVHMKESPNCSREIGINSNIC